MNPHVFPSSFLFIFIFFFLHLSLCLDVNEYSGYNSCSRDVECGYIKHVRYPFWGNGRPPICGHPGFEIKCQDGSSPEIEIMSIRYRVLYMNQTHPILTIARMDLLNEVCPKRFVNTTLNFNLFHYYDPNNQNLTLFYACQSENRSPLGNQFSCQINDTTSPAYYDTESQIRPPCNISIKVPVLLTAGLAGRVAIQIGTPSSTNDTSTLLQTALRGGFDVEYVVDVQHCKLCEESGGQCGYNSKPICFCPRGSPNCTAMLAAPKLSPSGGMLTPHAAPHPAPVHYPPSTGMLTPQAAPRPAPVPNPLTPGKKGFNVRSKIAIALSMLGSGIMVATIVICFLRKKFTSKHPILHGKKKTKINLNVEAFLKNHRSFAPKRYSYSDVKVMTNSFKDKLGQGGYGGVFKGKLLNGCLVAVKVLSESKGNGEEFINEVASISRTSHVNIVSLLGYCSEGPKRALIYEFMANGSLEKFIYPETHVLLGWEKLYQITASIARGLEYLHRGCNTRILHFDIKPHNILLDQDFCPKISDFGLAKLCPTRDSIISMTGARGTIGYIAPEVVFKNFGRVSNKSDVYSYGMMVLEMVGGRKNIDVGVDHTSEIYFPHWIYKRLELDDNLGLHMVISQDEGVIIRKMILVGLWCIQTNPSDRPSMSRVVEMLEGSVESLQIPPKPFLSSPSRSPVDSSSI